MATVNAMRAVALTYHLQVREVARPGQKFDSVIDSLDSIPIQPVPEGYLRVAIESGQWQDLKAFDKAVKDLLARQKEQN